MTALVQVQIHAYKYTSNKPVVYESQHKQQP